jgi:tetratricopeptide (TPR) repeat protein
VAGPRSRRARRAGPAFLRLAAALALTLNAPVVGAAPPIPLELRFDGRPLDPKARPDFSCFNTTLGRWVTCRVEKADASGAYHLERPEPAQYRLHVSVDENLRNPRRYPGDYEAQVGFEVTDTGPERLIVDLARLIHLTRPGDNARSLEGMLMGCATQPAFETPRHSWGPVATVEFGWEPIVSGAEYSVTLVAVSCDRPSAQRGIWSEKTRATSVALHLPPSADDEHYVLRVEARRNGRLVGALYTHDGGTHSWNYRFRVRDASVPRWAYLVAGAGLVLLVVGAVKAFEGRTRKERRRRRRLAAGGALAALVVAAVVGGGYLHDRSRERRRAEEAKAAAESARQARHREFIAAFVSAAPRPAWWATLETPYTVDSVGDLLSAWQGHPRGDDGAGERQFFKAAYQGVLDHPDDEHLVATALELVPLVVRDYPHRLELARFGYDRYFQHRRRLDNCANCMVGDTTQGLVQNLSQLYLDAGRHDEALEVCRRLIAERGADVSPYKLAETWERIAWVHWQKGEHPRALEVIADALARYGDTARGDDLRRTRAYFERGRAVTAPAIRH